MNLSCFDKNFIENFLNVESHASIKSSCHSYLEADCLVSQCSEKLKQTLSSEQLKIYQQELENRNEAEEILKQYYFSVGLKLYSHIAEITNNPSAFTDALYSDML